MAASTTGLAWYRLEQWTRLREVSEDAERLVEEKYDDWLQVAQCILRGLQDRGVRVQPTEVDVGYPAEKTLGRMPLKNQSSHALPANGRIL